MTMKCGVELNDIKATEVAKWINAQSVLIQGTIQENILDDLDVNLIIPLMIKMGVGVELKDIKATEVAKWFLLRDK